MSPWSSEPSSPTCCVYSAKVVLAFEGLFNLHELDTLGTKVDNEIQRAAGRQVRRGRDADLVDAIVNQASDVVLSVLHVRGKGPVVVGFPMTLHEFEHDTLTVDGDEHVGDATAIMGDR